MLELDLGRVELSLAGPRRPQDRLEPARTAFAMRGPTDAEDDLISDVGRDARLGDRWPGVTMRRTGPRDGAVAIAAITSCTNTSDPKMLIAAGLLARKARQHGLAPPPG